MRYRRCGRSGLKLPEISLGLWHNFGFDRPHETQRAICRRAFDLGITHFDLANNYGPPYGSAETTFGRMLAEDFRPYRDELVISTKAGYDMWPGPYGEWGSRKYLLASLDASLDRMGLDYVDIFYSHRFDPDTPLEETMGALDTAVRSGRALYAGISSYSSARTVDAARILRELGTPLLIHQPSYSMLNRWIEDDRRRTERVDAHRRGARPGPCPGRGGSPARAEPGAARAGLGASRSPDDLAGDRCQQRPAARGERGGAGESGALRRGAGRDRPARHRRRHQPLGPIQLRLTAPDPRPYAAAD